MCSRFLYGFSLFVCGLACAAKAHATEPTPSDSWRQFRGDGADGMAIGANPPTQWGEDTNCVWNTEIHGRGWSSPVVDAGEIWLTTATEDGLKMYVVCVELETGKLQLDKLLFENESAQEDHHATNSYASPTPVLSSNYVYVHFGAYGTACLDRKTHDVVWQRRDLECNHYRGPGSSPILHEDMLIFHMDGFDFQYAIALNALTGETVWKVDRAIDYGTDNGDFYKAFSTPIVISVNGELQLISPASKACLALEPDTGREIWRVRYEEHSTTVRPLFDGRRVYLSTGFGKAKMMAVRVDGRGDVTESHVDWVQEDKIGSKPSPILVGEKLFVVWDKGILVRLSTQTGEIEEQVRLGGNYAASLVGTDKFIYAFDQTGTGHCLTVADVPQVVSKNTLPDGCNASPAIVGDSLIVRTDKRLYRFDRP